MAQLEDLKNQINKIMQENKPDVVYNSKADKKIREVEQELYAAEVKKPFRMSIAELAPELATAPFGGSGFKRTDYALSWQQDPKGAYRLVLTNLPHNNSKVLMTTPEQFKNDITPLLPQFLARFSEVIKTTPVEYEESYADDSENPDA